MKQYTEHDRRTILAELGTSGKSLREFCEAPLFSGDLFLFYGKSKRVLKILYWDRNGFCLWTKRLERGSFPWPGK